MVSVIAKKLANKRQHKGRHYFVTVWIAKVYSPRLHLKFPHFIFASKKLSMAARAGFHAMAKLKKLQMENKGEQYFLSNWSSIER